jgi:hypothetical protein
MDSDELRAFAGRHYPELAGRMIPADLLMAWIFVHHDHIGEDGEGGVVVDSTELEDFIRGEIASPTMPG